MEKVDLKKETEFLPAFRPKILRMASTYKVPLICMEPGQMIPPHPSGTGVFYVVSGSGVMTVDGQDVDISEGEMIFIEKGQSRGIRATERLVVFAVHMG
jgi:mannose-6-phosphate isomerase-like protein (cupin superfamily)